MSDLSNLRAELGISAQEATDPYTVDPISQAQELIRAGDIELANQLIQPIIKELEFSGETPSQAVRDILETIVLHDALKYGVKSNRSPA